MPSDLFSGTQEGAIAPHAQGNVQIKRRHGQHARDGRAEVGRCGEKGVEVFGDEDFRLQAVQFLKQSLQQGQLIRPISTAEYSDLHILIFNCMTLFRSLPNRPTFALHFLDVQM